MLIDLLQASPQDVFECDICVIGSGPAGATIALELSDTRLKVLVVESGGIERHAEIDTLNEIESVGRPREMDQWLVRNRIVGGSSHTWAGKCAPFDAIDYDTRDWVPHSGWPFDDEHVNPFLARSASYLGLGIGEGYSGNKFWSLANRVAPQPALNQALLEPFFWQMSRAHENRFDNMRFGSELLKRLPTSVDLLINATVIQVNANATCNAVHGVDVMSLRGSRHTIKARAVVLSAGGIENARLLLASTNIAPRGLGNEHDLVGRFLMDHPRGTVGRFALPRVEKTLQRFGMYHVRLGGNNYRFRHGFRLSPVIQRQEGLLNCAAWLNEEVPKDDPWKALKRVLRGKSRSMSDAYAIALNAHRLVKGAADLMMRKNSLSRTLERVELFCMSEQVPDPASRVTLSTKKDRFGLPISRIDWRINNLEERSIRRTAELVSSELERIGYEPPKLDSWLDRGEGLPSAFVDIAHPTGTTRMSASKTQGVVDADCQVHGLDGLYVAGSSVFPTAGHANPTQMIVALAIRTADILARRFAPQQAIKADVPYAAHAS